MFGAGGSAFATPVLALLGVPGALAIAAPLPAVFTASLAGGSRCLRSGNLDRRLAGLAVAGGLPGTVLGALASTAIGDHRLLVLSGVMLFAVGARVMLPDRPGHAARAAVRRGRGGLVVS